MILGLQVVNLQKDVLWLFDQDHILDTYRLWPVTSDFSVTRTTSAMIFNLSIPFSFKKP